MRIGIATSVIFVLALAWTPNAGAGSCPSSLVIDDFSTGKYRIPPLKVGSKTTTKTGAMIGGKRLTVFGICDTETPGECSAANPFNQPAAFEIRTQIPRALIVGTGIRQFFSLVVSYGDASGGVDELDADLGCFSKFLVYFDANDQTVNFNMQVIASNNTAIATCAINQEGNPSGGFVAEFPFSCFVPNSGPSPDFNEIDLIDLVIGNGNAIGGNDFAITKIEAVP